MGQRVQTVQKKKVDKLHKNGEKRLLWYMQDGTRAHSTTHVLRGVSESFGPKIITTRLCIIWSLQSPNINYQAVFLRGIHFEVRLCEQFCGPL